MKSHHQQRIKTAVTVLALLLSAGQANAQVNTCPLVGWQEGLKTYLGSAASFPYTDTANDTAANPAPDCVFQQWSAEAFVWATALDGNGVPRFMTLQTLDQLLPSASSKQSAKKGKLKLKLGTRALHGHGLTGTTEGAGAIVQADGNMMVGPTGYPVYASVHMNSSYFNTAQKNLVATGGYVNQPSGSYFNPGAAVFKATWLRVDNLQQVPTGAFVTQAQVPVLQVLRTKSNYAVVPSGQYATVTVALVGLHVVGYTTNHPEFLWATFEHNLNTPQVADNQFSTSGSSSSNYTFYTQNTSYAQVNQPNPPQQGQSYIPPQLNFNPLTQKFSPATNAVLENQTGGANFGSGVADIGGINTSLQGFYGGMVNSKTGQKLPQAVFGNYNLIGTVWLQANTYVESNPNVMSTGANNAIGSVNLANTTAETFEQYPTNSNMSKVQNCFMCHNPTSLPNNNPGQPGNFPPRRISISHALEVGSPQQVQNILVVPINNLESTLKAEKK